MRELLVEVQPRRVLLDEQLGGRAALRVDRVEHLLGLLAVLHEHGERRALVPGDGREVRVLLRVPLHPDGLPAARGGDPEPDLGVRLPRRRVREDVRRLLRVHRVGDRPARHLREVGLLVGEPLAVRRPPVAGEARHLLLGDELGEAVGLLLGAAGGDPPLAVRRHVHRVEVGVAHVGDLGAVRREVGIDRARPRSSARSPSRPRARRRRAARRARRRSACRPSRAESR